LGDNINTLKKNSGIIVAGKEAGLDLNTGDVDVSSSERKTKA
jgi:hypothetical protein